jgi:UDP-N-acetylglucosamine:LPS N-acetylglucosamine transferase
VDKHLCAADIVIAHAGQSAVADIAAGGRPAIVSPEDRPFGEQHATAAVPDKDGLAIVRSGWPVPEEWSALIEEASRRGGTRWTRRQTSGTAERAAAIIEQVMRTRSIVGARR